MIYLVVRNIIRTFAPAIKRHSVGAIAQLVEQRTENPCVPGSIPGGTTSKSRISEMKFGFLFVFTRKRLRLKVVIVCRNL